MKCPLFPNQRFQHEPIDRRLPCRPKSLSSPTTTLWYPPKKVEPDQGVFLEFAPIKRRYDIPYEQQQDPTLAEGGLHALEANLTVFPKDTAQVLEYWLDVSRFSRWKRPGVKLPWDKEVFLADVEFYRKRGIRHMTTFAAWVDATYEERFGDDPEGSARNVPAIRFVNGLECCRTVPAVCDGRCSASNTFRCSTMAAGRNGILGRQ